VADVISALRSREQRERVGHERDDPIECSRPRRPEERLQFGERLFDGIEVGTVGRQEPDKRADGFDRRADLWLFMHHQVIEDDDVAGAECRRQDLFDVGEEAHVVDRVIKDGRGAESLDRQRGDHRRRLPMTTGGVVVQTSASRTAPIAPQQIRGNAALVQKDVLVGVVQRERGLPVPALRSDVRPSLFVGVNGFF
jgi:hypothetical protein